MRNKSDLTLETMLFNNHVKLRFLNCVSQKRHNMPQITKLWNYCCFQHCGNSRHSAAEDPLIQTLLLCSLMFVTLLCIIFLLHICYGLFPVSKVLFKMFIILKHFVTYLCERYDNNKKKIFTEKHISPEQYPHLIVV